MTTQGFTRKLTAILSADVKGYSRLMGEDEGATVHTLTTYREVISRVIRIHRGRVVDSPGDNLLAEFASVVNAVQCAVEIQQALKSKNAELPENRRMEFRIGVNLGDVIEEGDRIYGDGINIAARIEGLAEAGGICISGSAFEQIENKLDLGYEYLGKHTVKNIAKPIVVYKVSVEPRGCKTREAGPIHRRRAHWALVAVLIVGAAVLAIWNRSLRPDAPPAAAPSEQSSGIEASDKPSIAVLPFLNISGDSEQGYFADGITEDLITDLSKVSGLLVIARNSVFTYKDKSVKIQEVGQELGVRYVLEGSVRKFGDRVRITAQLVDAKRGGHLWAERYDRDLKDIFALQDEVTQKIVTALAVQLTEDEHMRLARKYTANLEAYDYILRGKDHLRRLSKESIAQSRVMFRKAIALAPVYAWGYSLLGKTYLLEWSFGWTQDPQSLELAFEMAQKAIALDDLLSSGHLLLGEVYLWKKQHEKSINEFEKAIALAPNDADGFMGLGSVLSWAGRPEEAVVLVNKAILLNPKYPSWYLWSLGHAHFLREHYEDAISAFNRCLTRNPNFLPAHFYLAVSYTISGRQEEARAEAVKFKKMSPYLSSETWKERLPYKDNLVLERIFDIARKAGLE